MKAPEPKPTAQFSLGENASPFETVSQVPQAPGIYRFFDVNGRLLYVGKAKLLRKRVESYFRPHLAIPRIRLMMSQVASFAVTVTRTEAEALLLENNLIKEGAPRYNILFRDDKSYPYIALKGGDFPRLAFYRGATTEAKGYFGPFPNVVAVRESIRFLQRVFQLRTCEDSVFAHRSRPCLLHQIGRCSAPCVGLVSQSEYQQAVQLATWSLEGKNHDVLNRLDQEMQAAAQALQYEKAATCRDQIGLLRQVMQRQYAVSKEGNNVDIIALACHGDAWSVNLSIVREGKLLGDRSIQPTHAYAASEQDVMTAFLEHHYSHHPLPGKVLVMVMPDSPTQAWLSEHAAVTLPRFELEKGWMRMAQMNATVALQAAATTQAAVQQRLTALQELLDIDNPHPWMECFDVSHFDGEYTVASCVVWTGGKMEKRHYRRFRIRHQTPGDDPGALTEALQRRFASDGTEEKVVPDVLFIDGGISQVKAAMRVLQDLGVSGICLVGIAKGKQRKAGEETLIASDGTTCKLPADHPALHLIQVLRDEAHRFAVMGHRAGRDKARRRSTLEDIPGIGAARRKRLLQSFGGLDGIKDAGIEDLCQISGIHRTLAEVIYQHFHPLPDGMPK